MALPRGEHLRRGHGGLRLHEYGDQVRAVLLGEYPSELQDGAADVARAAAQNKGARSA